ncbi:MAG: SIS domain-containing protein [Candidatus Hydrogenedentes bacterium]|nr:SIS domain-containing protein [Candidatus Hydrogenedentota bacterium]
MAKLAAAERAVLDAMVARRPDLEECVEGLLAVHGALVRVYDGGGKLLLCGNGGSHADAMHIAGELCKSFERKRPIPAATAKRFKGLPHGDDLRWHLEAGLPAITLGLNGSLKTAVENDSPLRDMAFAQEAFALAKNTDLLLALSTSGNAQNCLMAMTAVKALGASTVAFTGPKGGHMAEAADIAIKAPGDSTKVIQEAHIVLYHTCCAMIEAHYFPSPR